MFHWSQYQTEQYEESGQFICPECGADTIYDLYRTYRHARLFVMIIPITHSKELFFETVRCQSCGASLSITVLAINASVVGSVMDAGTEAGCGISSNLGNIVEISEAAAQEILRRHFTGEFKAKPVVRISLPLSPGEGYMVGFDFALADGRDWIGESRGIGIIVDRRDAPLLLGRTIGFCNGIFRDDTPNARI